MSSALVRSTLYQPGNVEIGLEAKEKSVGNCCYSYVATRVLSQCNDNISAMRCTNLGH